MLICFFCKFFTRLRTFLLPDPPINKSLWAEDAPDFLYEGYFILNIHESVLGLGHIETDSGDRAASSASSLVASLPLI